MHYKELADIKEELAERLVWQQNYSILSITLSKHLTVSSSVRG